jgi:hypothetical protein
MRAHRALRIFPALRRDAIWPPWAGARPRGPPFNLRAQARGAPGSLSLLPSCWPRRPATVPLPLALRRCARPPAQLTSGENVLTPWSYSLRVANI